MTTSQTPTQTEPRKVIETRYYNHENSIYQANFVRRSNGKGTWDTVEIFDQAGEWVESNRQWISKYYPEIAQDIAQDPIEGWTW